MDVKALAKNVGISQKKALVVASVVKGLNALEASETLKYIKKDAAIHIKKVVDSAIANAVHNHGLNKANLIIKDIFVNKGIIYKRYRMKGKGGYAPFIRPHSNISVIISEKTEVGQPQSLAKKTVKKIDKPKKEKLKNSEKKSKSLTVKEQKNSKML